MEDHIAYMRELERMPRDIVTLSKKEWTAECLNRGTGSSMRSTYFRCPACGIPHSLAEWRQLVDWDIACECAARKCVLGSRPDDIFDSHTEADWRTYARYLSCLEPIRVVEKHRVWTMFDFMQDPLSKDRFWEESPLAFTPHCERCVVRTPVTQVLMDGRLKWTCRECLLAEVEWPKRDRDVQPVLQFSTGGAT